MELSKRTRTLWMQVASLLHLSFTRICRTFRNHVQKKASLPATSKSCPALSHALHSFHTAVESLNPAAMAGVAGVAALPTWLRCGAVSTHRAFHPAHPIPQKRRERKKRKNNEPLEPAGLATKLHVVFSATSSLGALP